MALKSANQQGNTLIEFMVAALVGAMALAIVGTVFCLTKKRQRNAVKKLCCFSKSAALCSR